MARLASHSAACATPAMPAACSAACQTFGPPLRPCPHPRPLGVQVCTSELGAAAKLQDEFKKRGVQLVALSCNDLDSHKQVGRGGRECDVCCRAQEAPGTAGCCD